MEQKEKANAWSITSLVVGILIVIFSAVLIFNSFESAFTVLINLLFEGEDGSGLIFIFIWPFALVFLAFALIGAMFYLTIGVLEIVKANIIDKNRKINKVLFIIQTCLWVVGIFITIIIPATAKCYHFYSLILPIILSSVCIVMGAIKLASNKDVKEVLPKEVSKDINIVPAVIEPKQLEESQHVEPNKKTTKSKEVEKSTKRTNVKVKKVTEVRFCINCGAKADNDSKFCMYCGKEIKR